MRSNCDDVASTLPMWKYNTEIAKIAIKQKINYVDVGSIDTIFELNEEAKEADINIISSTGFHPGIVSILIGYGSKKIDKVKKNKNLGR
jgi:saccharopine dehydrogenase-like NADP-dependent oxidoreductase